jgi:endonuclease-8
MEGPSLFLAAEQLAPFAGKKVIAVSGNTKIGKERFAGQKVGDIFSWGKHLVFQFNDFALRVHFLLFGTFQARVKNDWVTGDYKKKSQSPRLVLEFSNGHIEMYSCSVKFIEDSRAKKTYDFSADIMAREWDPAKALQKILSYPNEQVADVLLDQDIFAGVGNIIKNEVLFLARIHPERAVGKISRPKLKKLIQITQDFSRQFYVWRKAFVLKKNLQIYRHSVCPVCGGKVIWRITGKRKRRSFYCPRCQKV